MPTNDESRTPIPIVVDVSRTLEDIAEVKAKQAAHAEQLRQHDRVIDALEDHLGKLVEKIGGIEKRILVGIALIFGSSAGLADIIRTAAGL